MVLMTILYDPHEDNVFAICNRDLTQPYLDVDNEKWYYIRYSLESRLDTVGQLWCRKFCKSPDEFNTNLFEIEALKQYIFAVYPNDVTFVTKEEFFNHEQTNYDNRDL